MDTSRDARGRAPTVAVVAEEPLETELLSHEFPTVEIRQVESTGPGDTVIDDFAWRGAFDLARFDEAIDSAAAPPPPVAIRGDDAAGVACEVLTRYQRLVGRRNAASTTRLFDGVLHALAPLETTPPYLKGDVDHMLDTWQWVLRLDGAASLRTQLAALLHEVDRLGADPRERLEHRARVDTKERSSFERALQMLRVAGVSHEDAQGVRDILSGHADHERDALLIDDADALSFLSLSSARYADHFGLAQTRRKVAFTASRLGDVARRKLPLVRLRPDVARLLQGVAA